MFSALAEEVKREGLDFEDSDVSEVDPEDLLKSLKNIDDMEANLLNAGAAPAQTKTLATERLKKDFSVLEAHNNSDGTDEAKRGTKKPSLNSSFAGRSFKKFSFDNDEDDGEPLGQTSDIKGTLVSLDNPLDDVLDDLLPGESQPESKPRLSKAEKSLPSALASPNLKNRTTKTSKNDVFSFTDDDNGNLIDDLGLNRDKNKKKEASFWSSKEKSNDSQRPRTRIDDILEGFTSSHLLDRPPTGERNDQIQSQEKQQQEKNSTVRDLDGDFTFGSYQPTVGSTPEGRQSRRQSVKFSTEDVSISTPEKKPKPTIRHRNSSDWLGLKTDSESDRLGDGPKEVKASVLSPKGPFSPISDRKLSVTGGQATFLTKTATGADVETKQNKSEAAKGQRKGEEEEDDWLAGALTRRKALSASNNETKTSTQQDFVGVDPAVRNQITPQTSRGIEDTLPSIRDTSPAAHSTPVREEKPNQDPQQTQRTSTAVQQQVSITADLQPQNPLLGLGSVAISEVLQKQHGDEPLQAWVIQLEGQVKVLQLERDQSRMMLENMQQRHKQDLELLESAHKTRVKLLEESAAQRETRARLECEELMERLASLTRSAEQERSDLLAQYHRKLAQAQQDRDREVDRLRDLQRKSILEMKKDHEDQLQRLKRLKDEEIDAVTSATSQTRSLTGVIEQMEQFSSRLGELSSRVESSHEHTAQGLEQGARHRDEQLRTMQDRLTQQQKATAEERTYLKDIISRMDAQLSEQQRQLEKERWKATAEQAKAESIQRGLEEERRVLTLQISMEREELERAKCALLEEQKTVMQHCAEERRKLAAEWTHFHTQEKQRHERAEREVNSLLERREGSIISLAQEQAELKLRMAELKLKEAAVSQEKEALDRLREDLDRDKERISNTALRLKTRAQEVEAFGKLASEKQEEGERALREARRSEAEHEARLQNIHSQTASLRLLEQRVLKERMQSHHLQGDETRQMLSTSPSAQNIPPVLPDSVFLPIPELSTSQNILPQSSYRSLALETSLALWKYTGDKDKDFLEEQQIFLENLKKMNHKLKTA
ncbi:fas-binding factor 1 homolog [Nothobranchius furzeri]|uniref:Fas (TNFRSF6) binding factor 1 n=1 Tax=Nothobranchius furzeri TaxID=105023 RepID=A0A1A7Z953_NOTFU|nr:transcript variant X2 [Nothobranchius furzeri]KAF7221497.1 transcript variant X1 [Nothobranchius furzeri]